MYISSIDSAMTESQLIKAVGRLEALLKNGNGTMSDANALAEYRRQLERIQDVKYQRSW